MKQIPLTQGLFAIVDDDDFDHLYKFKWYAKKKSHCYYACRKKNVNGKKTVITMHSHILKITPELPFIDHINLNGLDNQKSNLRLCTKTQNCRNRSKKPGRFSSDYKGVQLDKQTGKWKSFIHFDGKSITKTFSSEIEAALHYNKMASQHFGEFALLNKI